MIDGLKLARDEFLGLLIERGQDLLRVTEDEIAELAEELKRAESRWEIDPPRPEEEQAHERGWELVRDWDEGVSVLGLPGGARDRQLAALAVLGL